MIGNLNREVERELKRTKKKLLAGKRERDRYRGERREKM
jgi:hypothetical protein